MTTRDEAEAVRQRYEQRMVSTPGVSGVDVREDEPDKAEIVLYLADDTDLPEWLTAEHLDGIPLRRQRRRFEPL